jgi:hypothetical protein
MAAGAETALLRKQITLSAKVSVMAITAVLYAIARAATPVVTPSGVGQLLVGTFVIAFFAVISDPLSVAIGAGLGTFIADSLVLTSLGGTNPALSLAAGVPANFVAALLLGYFVQRYRSWPAFVAGVVIFISLGDLIAGVLVVALGPLAFPQLINGLVAKFGAAQLSLGLTLYWNTTAIPAALIVTPPLIKAVRPQVSRSSIVTSYPAWGGSRVSNTVLTSVVLGGLFALSEALFLLSAANASFIQIIAVNMTFYAEIASILILIAAPVIGVLLSKPRGATNAVKHL